MGFLKDLLKDFADTATGGAISLSEAETAINQLEALEKDTSKFNDWYKTHSKSYTDIRDALNNKDYQVDRKIFHANWSGSKVVSDEKSIYEENNENERRKNLLDQALTKQSVGQMKKMFEKYLKDTEKNILDSYNTYHDFKNELSYLPEFQKKIVDTAYFNEVEELLNSSGFEAALTKIGDYLWQIEKHKTPAGHAIVVMLLCELVYFDEEGYSGEVKKQIRKALSTAEDCIIDNSCKLFLPEDYENMSAEELLQIGKKAFISGDPEKALSCYYCSAKAGNAEAQYRVGLGFDMGYGIINNREKAIYWYKNSAESGSAVSKFYLARVYCGLLDEPNRDYAKAIRLYMEAFDEGVAEAADRIGTMFADGIGVEKSEAIAFMWYEKGINAGSPWAMYDAYSMILKSDGLEGSLDKATNYFDKCVESFAPPDKETDDFYDAMLLPGYDSVAEAIARVYYYGSDAIAENENRAEGWFEKGAAIGSDSCLDILADINYYSEWYTYAVEYARKAAKHWNHYSLNTLGVCYGEGKGVEKDEVISDIWYLKAAKAGDKDGQYNIARSFLSGNSGVPKDEKEARCWFEKSAAQGHEKSIIKLEELIKQDNQQQKALIAKKKVKLLIDKKALGSKLTEIDKKIDEAQTQKEEQQYIDEKEQIVAKISSLEAQLSKLK